MKNFNILENGDVEFDSYQDENLNDQIGNLLALQTYEERKEFAAILLGTIRTYFHEDTEIENLQPEDIAEVLSLVANEINGD